MKAMILAAGLGTRLKPFTNEHPKALAIINGKSLLQRNIEYLAAFGVTDIIVNVHHFPDQITDLIKSNKGFGSNITISDEHDQVLETGGGLMKARAFFENGEPFVLMNVDILTDMNISKMAEQHTSSKALATLAVTNRKTSRYFLFDDIEILCGWRNIKTGEQKVSKEAPELFQKAFSGIHIISPEIFSLIKITGKFSMVDVYLELCKTHTIMGFDHSTSKFIDVGTPENIVIAEEIFS
ncbi:MAG: nucleotidyltransferase family protein [Chitinophagaceae bacterium]|nr:nucleotidyltransferase family protein [Chitinophagaceae bacterium]MDB5223294.1 nucleotidyltransferase family protein [Chitinophagaceae bacterium]